MHGVERHGGLERGLTTHDHYIDRVELETRQVVEKRAGGWSVVGQGLEPEGQSKANKLGVEWRRVGLAEDQEPGRGGSSESKEEKKAVETGGSAQ